MLSAAWALEDRTRPMETRWGKGVQEFPERKKNQIMRFVQQWRGKVELVGAVVPAQCTKVCKLFQKESARSLEN